MITSHVRVGRLQLMSLLIAMVAACAVSFGAARPAVAASSSGITSSLDLTSQDEGYAAILYDNTNGLPTSEANDIAQTEDGFIWMGCYSGLIRHDGNTFERMGEEEGVTSVMCLLAGSKNRLWVGTNDRGLLMIDRGVYTWWDEEDGLPSASIRSIIEFDDGSLIIGTTDGIVTMDTDMAIHPLSDSRVKDEYVQDMHLGADGRVYGLTYDGDLFAIDKGKVVSYLQHESLHGDGASCIYPDPHESGAIYVELKESTLYRGKLEDGVNDMERIDISPLSQVQRLQLIDDELWILARNGIGILGADGLRVLDSLPMTSAAGDVIADYAGNLWFTSSSQGVMKIVPNRFVDYSGRNGLAEAVVNSTCMQGNRLFVATDSGLVVVEDGHPVDSIPLTEAKTASGVDLGVTDLIDYLSGCRIRSIIRDSQGRIWISTWFKCGLVRYEDGKILVFDEEDGMPTERVRTVYERKDGSFLVAGTGGVTVIRDDKVAKVYKESDGIANTAVLTVAEGKDGEILCGTDGGGIYVIDEDDGEIRHIGKAEGLTSEIVMRIKPDSDAGVYWLVTGNSLAYLSESFEVSTLEDWPYFNNFDLYEAKNGEMWVLSSDGVFIASKQSMLDNQEIETVHYAITNGLPCTATANSYSELDDAGNLYIAGSKGVVKVNIDQPFDDFGNLKALVPYVEADGELIYPDASGAFTIDSSVRRLTIHPFVLNYSLVNPEVTYHLKGFDQTDVSVARSNLKAVDYTNLPGGNYRFILELEDPVGHGTLTTTADIVKMRAIYEQPWFYVVCVAGAGVAAWRMVAAYVRHKIQETEERNRAEAERERIEGELDMARQIQGGALPDDFSTLSSRGDVDLFATMEPAKEVGGDFYDFFLIDDTHLCAVMADVSGKGIPASLFMMNSKSIIKSTAMQCLSPGEILSKSNDIICSSNDLDMFVTVWLGVLDLTTGRLVAANAGHEYPVIGRVGERFEFIHDKHGLVIGVYEGMKYKEYEIDLEPGDKIFLYTDGLAEAMNPAEELFGMDRIEKALNTNPGAAPQDVLAAAHAAVDEFVGEAEQFDDLTMMCIEYRGDEQGVEVATSSPANEPTGTVDGDGQ